MKSKRQKYKRESGVPDIRNFPVLPVVPRGQKAKGEPAVGCLFLFLNPAPAILIVGFG